MLIRSSSTVQWQNRRERGREVVMINVVSDMQGLTVITYLPVCHTSRSQ